MERNRFGFRDDYEGIPRLRLFGAREYQRVGVDTDHQSAKDEADSWRAAGDRARVVKCSRGRWAIYAA